MASVLMGAVDRDLLGHPAIAVKPEWFALAAQAHRALFRLYQEIGAAHLDGCGPSGAQETANAGQ
ncbi:hypothetical protein [Pararhodospirillum photometricum]|uniref:hypothetical protein n=1 Tax=Pararhodospirillum photometricum TaxID=1084 RepID=UPI0002E4C324|nr:hypothetical protein [Pararhodospirillum photometricum]